MRHLNGLYPILLFAAFSVGGFAALGLADMLIYFGVPVKLSAISVAKMGGFFAAFVLTYTMFVESILEVIEETNLVEVRVAA